MKSVIASLLLASCLAVPAAATTQEKMVEHFQSYQTALTAKDRDTARKHAKAALDIAEDVLGDHKTTGDLAQNYGDIADDLRTRVKAYERAVELVEFYPEADRVGVYLDRVTRYTEALVANRNTGKARKIIKDALAYAQGTEFANSTFVAELKVREAEMAVARGKHEETIELARAAREAFEAADDGIFTVDHYRAALYEGYGLEGEDQIMDAALAYQEVMQDTEGLLPRNHPFMMRALGRWTTMRERLKREGRLEEAQKAGLCDCWPYDKKRNESVQPVKRVPPVMPRNATQSGFSIVEFDLEDDGSTANIRVLESWPPDMFDDASARSVRKWKYNPRTAAETDGDRKDIITTVRYMLTDASGRVIE